MTTQIAVRIDDDLVEALDRLGDGAGHTRSEVIRAALKDYVYRAACERDAERYAAQPLTDDELAMADDPVAWEPTPVW